MENLDQKIAFITGGSKGIGFGIAQALSEAGVKVAISSRNIKEAENAAKQISQKGKAEVIALEVDVRNFESQQKAVENVKKKWGRLDILIANAGVGHFAPLDELSIEDWQQTIDTNLTGVFYSVKAAVAALKETEGYIFTISSLAGTNFFAGGAAYNASKFGVTGFTQAAMLDLRDYGIKVSTIMPGSVATHFNGHTPSEEDSWKIQIEDIGKIVVDLLRMNSRTLPSKIEVRPSQPPKK